MTKFSYILLFLFSSVVSAQSIEKYLQDSIREESHRKEERLLNKKLISEFQDTDFDELAGKIISDIDFNQFKSENVIFYCRNLCYERRGVLMYGEDICSVNMINPAYNQFHFWNKKNVRFIQKNTTKI